ncbi:L-rhamnose mutarotase [Devosia subaequoris]|uniref:L-rhamnose mutarotase n=1 Tax=Devosia subaequoris TaxID=395930 RepID=A0A7W6IPY8_9HYPH|nr:L-rhamnose mutarotase [Devosia subaequoris]MBB4053641.1 L-rhamnose mutarotase [Devosia subaequoris]MCP1211224.1 L-rhamnose mutarotase [Devosia subaequoris]
MTVGGPGAAVMYLYRLKPGMGEEYDRLHRAVWPEMLDLIDQAGIYDYQIWRHEEIVIVRLRTQHSFEQAAATTAASPIQARWTAYMGHVFAQTEAADGQPLWLNEVFSYRPGPSEVRR